MEISSPDSEFDIEILAKLVLRDLKVQSGQVIGIWASTHSLELVEALAYHIRASGAFWTLRLTMEDLLARIGQALPEEHLANVPGHELRWLEDLQAIIEVRDHGGYIPGVLASRRKAMGAEWRALIDEAEQLGIRRLKVIYPTQSLADAYGLDLDAFRDIVWRALSVDAAALEAVQAALRERLVRANEVHITTPLGSDLHLRMGGRPVFTDQQDLPRGEVYLAPLEDSAQGLAVIDLMFIRGQRIENQALRFVDGRVVFPSPKIGGDHVLQELLGASSGDANRIAEFAIGLNPLLETPVGIPALDEKIGGSVHIALGMNQHFGGANRANLHLDLVMLNARVWLDGEELDIDAPFKST